MGFAQADANFANDERRFPLALVADRHEHGQQDRDYPVLKETIVRRRHTGLEEPVARHEQ